MIFAALPKRGRAKLCGLTLGLSVAAATPPLAAQCEPADLPATLIEQGDDLGSVVSLSGGVAVASRGDFASENGTVHVFERSGADWLEVEQLSKPNQGAIIRSFGATLSLQADTLAVGAPRDNSQFVLGHDGSVSMFQRSPVGWVETDFLAVPGNDASETFSSAGFGSSLDLDGNRLLVGAPLAQNSLDVVDGRCYLFERTALGWQLEHSLEAGTTEGVWFGDPVALSGDVMAVNAQFYGGALPAGSGGVYMFHLDDGQWTSVGILQPDDLSPQDEFGEALALSGDRLLVSARKQAVNGVGSAGVIYAYERQGDTWQQTQRIEPPFAPVFNSRFGRELELEGDLAVASSNLDLGSVHVLRHEAGGWVLVDTLEEVSGEFAGTAIGLSGQTLIVGRPGFMIGVGQAVVVRGLARFTDLGGGLAGTQGVPILSLDGELCAATPLSVRLADAAPLSNAFLVLGLARLDAPFKGGALVPTPDVIAPGLTDAAGALELGVLWPAEVPGDLELLLQGWLLDAQGPLGFASSNTMRILTP